MSDKLNDGYGGSASAAGLRAAPGSEKIFGVTHRGTDGETKAYLEAGRLWISDGVGGWMCCNPGVESYFSPNDPSPAMTPTILTT